MSANQIETNRARASENIIEDADGRADMLAEEADALNREADQSRGARRNALRNAAEADLSAAAGVEREGRNAAQRIEANTEKEADDLSRRR